MRESWTTEWSHLSFFTLAGICGYPSSRLPTHLLSQTVLFSPCVVSSRHQESTKPGSSQHQDRPRTVHQIPKQGSPSPANSSLPGCQWSLVLGESTVIKEIVLQGLTTSCQNCLIICTSLLRKRKDLRQWKLFLSLLLLFFVFLRVSRDKFPWLGKGYFRQWFVYVTSGHQSHRHSFFFSTFTLNSGSTGADLLPGCIAWCWELGCGWSHHPGTEHNTQEAVSQPLPPSLAFLTMCQSTEPNSIAGDSSIAEIT